MNTTPQPFESLLPQQIAAKAEDAGVAKAGMDTTTTLMLAILAGAFIGLGAAFSTVASTGAASLPFGVGRIIAGATFSLGLILVVVAGAELFTGNNLLVIAHASGKVSASRVLRNWALVYLGNFIGAVATAAGMYAAGLHTMAGGKVGAVALTIAATKCGLTWDEAFMRGVYCNALVCLAVWLCMSCLTTGEKIMAIAMPVTAFVACGFEHSIANMYFVPFAILIRSLADPASFGELPGVALDQITWPRFAATLIPVTLGNIIGGGVLVGAVYWLVYCRGRARAS